VSRDEAARLADDSMQAFVASMAAAGNPGSGNHEVGLRKVDGWILQYDPTIGGSEVQAVIGLDGVIHARRRPRALRTQKWAASAWALRDSNDADPMVGAAGFAERLSQILTFNGVERDSRGGE
jgi:hypothetical protein